jgi:hypothetical protein
MARLVDTALEANSYEKTTSEIHLEGTFHITYLQKLYFVFTPN